MRVIFKCKEKVVAHIRDKDTNELISVVSIEEPSAPKPIEVIARKLRILIED